MTDVVIHPSWRSSMHNALRILIVIALGAWVANCFGKWVDQLSAGLAFFAFLIPSGVIVGRLWSFLEREAIGEAVQSGIAPDEARRAFDERYVD